MADKTTQPIENYPRAENLKLTEKRLKFGLWYISQKERLKKILIGFLIFFSVITWGWSFWSFGYYLLKGKSLDQLMITELVNSGFPNHNYILQISPSELEFGEVRVLSNENTYDFVIPVTNKNQKYWADFSYSFILDGNETAEQRSFILPNESKYLVFFGQKFPTTPNFVSININSVSWERISAHKFSDWPSFASSHLNIKPSQVDFAPAQNSGLSENLNINTLKFVLSNNTAYNYWNVDLIILIKSGADISGVQKYSLEQLRSGEERKVSLSFSGRFYGASSVEILPELDILDDKVYMNY